MKKKAAAKSTAFTLSAESRLNKCQQRDRRCFTGGRFVPARISYNAGTGALGRNLHIPKASLLLLAIFVCAPLWSQGSQGFDAVDFFGPAYQPA